MNNNLIYPDFPPFVFLLWFEEGTPKPDERVTLKTDM